MACNTRSAILTVLFLSIAASAQYDYPESTKQLDSLTGDIEDAVTIKLNPFEKRKKGDLRALVERLKLLPEVRGASIIAASAELLVLVPANGQNVDAIKRVLLQQPEVYELEVREEAFRREGDKPYDQLRKEKLAEALTSTKTKIRQKIQAKIKQLVEAKRRRAAEAKSPGGGPAGAGAGNAEGKMKKKRQGKRGGRRRAKRRAEGDDPSAEL